VEPGGRVVFIGLSGEPSLVDSRRIVMKDLTAVGILSASPTMRETIDLYASGRVDPRPLVAGTVGLAETSAVLEGQRPAGSGPGPKFHIDPRRD
jgi:threonine dehydrogenase-like Zn-dependent dehydrogenase